LEKNSYIKESKKEKEIIPLFEKDPSHNKILVDLQAAAKSKLFKEGMKQHQINLNRIL
tara:strand:- start:317 stop:490 length:174 start_codon:yes stop_codon:yes gene_type:complete